MEDTGRQPGSGLACLALLLRYHGEPADVSNLAHRFAPDVGEIDTINLLRAAKQSGLKARQVESNWDRLGKIALPAIAAARDGSQAWCATASFSAKCCWRPSSCN